MAKRRNGFISCQPPVGHHYGSEDINLLILSIEGAFSPKVPNYNMSNDEGEWTEVVQQRKAAPQKSVTRKSGSKTGGQQGQGSTNKSKKGKKLQNDANQLKGEERKTEDVAALTRKVESLQLEPIKAVASAGVELGQSYSTVVHSLAANHAQSLPTTVVQQLPMLTVAEFLELCNSHPSSIQDNELISRCVDLSCLTLIKLIMTLRSFNCFA